MWRILFAALHSLQIHQSTSITVIMGINIDSSKGIPVTTPIKHSNSLTALMVNVFMFYLT